MDLLAQRAGVGKATIYRRWESKEALILDALGTLATPIPATDAGNLRADLIAYTDGWSNASLQGRGSDVLPHLIEASCYDEQLRASLDEYTRGPAVGDPAILQRGIDRGELSADTDVDLLVDVVLGPFFYRHLLTGAPVDRDVHPPPRRPRPALTASTGRAATAPRRWDPACASRVDSGRAQLDRVAVDLPQHGRTVTVPAHGERHRRRRPGDEPWASSSAPRHAGGMPSGNSTGPHASRRSTAATARIPVAAATWADAGRRIRRRDAGEIAARPVARRRAARTTAAASRAASTSQPRRGARRPRRPRRRRARVPRSSPSSSPSRTSSVTASRNPTGSSPTRRRPGQQQVAAGRDDAARRRRRRAGRGDSPARPGPPSRGRRLGGRQSRRERSGAGSVVVPGRRSPLPGGRWADDDRRGRQVDALDRHVRRRPGSSAGRPG